MEKEKNKKQQGLFEAYLIPLTSRLLQIPYLRAIRESVYVMMPIIMMLALINMVGNLVLNPQGPVMSESGLGLGTFLSGGLRDQAYRDSDLYLSLMTYIEYLNITYFLYYLIFSVIFTGRLAKLWHVERLPAILSTLTGYVFMLSIFTEGLENIYSYAFSGCKTLKEVTLPSSLIYCLNYPFYGCSGIESISSLALLPPTVRNNVITYEARNIQLRVPLWSFQEYMTTPGWLEFQANMVIDPNIRPDNVVINKEFEFVLGEDQNLKDYEPNIRMLYNSDEIDDGFGNRKYERGNLTISNRSKLKINDFSMFFSPYAKYYAD